MRALLVTDAWYPQVNGVVRTLNEMRVRLTRQGYDVRVVGPQGLTFPCPTYPEIRLTYNPAAHLFEILEEWPPDHIHIATEGPLGWAMRGICLERGWDFTTSFHTRFPEYLKTRFRLPRRWTYEVLRRFHSYSSRILVPTPTVQRDLLRQGFERVRVWGRGVDTEIFHPAHRHALPYEGPIQLYVGRLAVEKNLPAFLGADTPGTKLVVGDGPERATLTKRFPQAVFLGALHGKDLSQIFASADVFVFPSLTDTFGLVMLEALASGTPVAALPSSASQDVLEDERVACLHDNIELAIAEALTRSRAHCRSFALRHSWDRCASLFAESLVLRRGQQTISDQVKLSTPSLDPNLFRTQY